MDVRHQIERLLEEATYTAAHVAALLDGQQCCDAFRQAVRVGGVDDALRIEPRRLDLSQPVVRTEQQIVQRQRVPGLPLELVPQRVQRAMQLAGYALDTPIIGLPEPALALGQRPRFLLDNEHGASLVDDDEIRFAERRRRGPALRPVDAMVDGVGRRQPPLQHGQRLKLARVARSEVADQVGPWQAIGVRGRPLLSRVEEPPTALGSTLFCVAVQLDETGRDWLVPAKKQIGLPFRRGAMMLALDHAFRVEADRVDLRVAKKIADRPPERRSATDFCEMRADCLPDGFQSGSVIQSQHVVFQLDSLPPFNAGYRDDENRRRHRAL